ncbi:MAG: peptide chain release factor N(5)-glutamine methyltransferase [Firmicutes bacterium]|nr:peptide chain release factor N(5)-glutamine methyltransferase [Bacillota bacterium]
MNIRDALKRGCEVLEGAGSESPRLDAQVLLLAVLREERTVLVSHPERELASQEEQLYNQYISERALGKPVSYITGVKEFMGLEFAVNEAVLIPRPETELLVEEAVKELEAISREAEAVPRVLDLCTGSGAIAISIRHFLPQAEVTATDLSEEALQVARENAGRILGESEDSIRFLQGDLFEAFSDFQSPGSGLFNLIVSNPPYIPAKVIDGLMPDVKDYEPRLALDGGADGLDIYRRLIPQAAEDLAPGGVLLLEIGHDQGETVPDLCRQAGLGNITVLKDLAGLDRVVRAERIFAEKP